MPYEGNFEVQELFFLCFVGEFCEKVLLLHEVKIVGMLWRAG